MRAGFLAIVVALAAACGDRRDEVGPDAGARWGASASADAGARSGASALAKFECNRCHAGTPLGAAPPQRDCVSCHASQPSGKGAKVTHLRASPSLANVGARLRRDWIEAFLRDPYVVRPQLGASMPRLALSADDARAIAAELAPPDPPAGPPPRGDAARGRELLDARACRSCHAFSGAPGSANAHPQAALAPDLRHARDRLRADAIPAWLESHVSPPLSPDDARDVTAYVLSAPLAASGAKPAAASGLPLLKRRVRFDEVEAKVFRKACTHCHATPDARLGDRGAGNTGGFGFAARGLDLSSYRSIGQGLVDENGVRKGAFASSDGTPLLVRVLRARVEEEQGRTTDGVRGMPLGLPALSPEDLQLVETWIAQGHPR